MLIYFLIFVFSFIELQRTYKIGENRFLLSSSDLHAALVQSGKDIKDCRAFVSLCKRTFGVKKFESLTWAEVEADDKQNIVDLLSFYVHAFFSKFKKDCSLKEHCAKFEEVLKKVKQHFGNQKCRNKV